MLKLGKIEGEPAVPRGTFSREAWGTMKSEDGSHQSSCQVIDYQATTLHLLKIE
jgi:hypothetical protein